jgi:hypothetical protein
LATPIATRHGVWVSARNRLTGQRCGVGDAAWLTSVTPSGSLSLEGQDFKAGDARRWGVPSVAGLGYAAESPAEVLAYVDGHVPETLGAAVEISASRRPAGLVSAYLSVASSQCLSKVKRREALNE